VTLSSWKTWALGTWHGIPAYFPAFVPFGTFSNKNKEKKRKEKKINHD
jgi:hypothetical protein